MKRWGVRFLVTLLSGTAWAERASVNTISKVEARGSIIEIVGSKEPSFTSFTMTDPPRLVIDIAEGVFSGVPDEQPGSGSVSSIKTASYGSDSSAIARVLIAFSREVETDLTSAGSKLVIKILGAPAPSVARAEKPAAAPRGDATSGAAAQAGAPQPQLAKDAESSEREAASEAGRAGQDEKLKDAFARAQREREADQGAAAERAEAERQEQSRRAEAEKQRQDEERARVAEQERAAEQQRLALAEQARREAVAEEKRRAEEEERLAREQARAEADQAKREAAAEQERQAEQERAAEQQRLALAEQARREAVAEEKRRAEEEERLAREQARAEADQAKREAAAEQERQGEQERLAKAKAKAELDEIERQASAEEKRRAEGELAAEARAKAQADEARRQAAAERRPQVQEARPSAIAERKSKPVRSRRATMTFVGFKQADSVSRVYVRTDGPVQYSVQEDGDKRVVLELENTRIALRNNRRPLDTSFFNSAVAMVAPGSAGGSVRIEIKLRERASFQARQDGNEVSVEFSRPPHP